MVRIEPHSSFSVLNDLGSVPLRREIRYLWANAPEQWDLFLLGLAALKTVDGYLTPTDGSTGIKRSFYQLAGEQIIEPDVIRKGL